HGQVVEVGGPLGPDVDRTALARVEVEADVAAYPQVRVAGEGVAGGAVRASGRLDGGHVCVQPVGNLGARGPLVEPDAAGVAGLGAPEVDESGGGLAVPVDGVHRHRAPGPLDGEGGGGVHVVRPAAEDPRDDLAGVPAWLGPGRVQPDLCAGFAAGRHV